MRDKKPFEVDLGDIDGMKARIPELEQIVAEAKEAIGDAHRAHLYWAGVLQRVLFLTGETPSEPKANPAGEPSAKDRVLKAFNESAVPLRSREIAERLDMNRETANWAVWKLHKEKRIQKLEPGLYASLLYSGPEVSGENGNEARKPLSAAKASGGGGG